MKVYWIRQKIEQSISGKEKINAVVAQLVGGASLKMMTVWVQIPPTALQQTA